MNFCNFFIKIIAIDAEKKEYEFKILDRDKFELNKKYFTAGDEKVETFFILNNKIYDIQLEGMELYVYKEKLAEMFGGNPKFFQMAQSGFITKHCDGFITTAPRFTIKKMTGSTNYTVQRKTENKSFHDNNSTTTTNAEAPVEIIGTNETGLYVDSVIYVMTNLLSTGKKNPSC
jgi:hypothetical protein